MRVIKFRFGFKAGNSIIFRHMTLDELLDCDNAYESMNLSINEELSIEGGEDLQEFDLISKDEFTGLQDAIGVGIYEGDIVEEIRLVSTGELYKNALVQYKAPSFEVDGLALSDYMGITWRVIGNIHQNLELVKEAV